MNQSRIVSIVYYQLKPFIPREIQIWLRRRLILRKRLQYENVWPIDEGAAKIPEGWSGWPEGKRFALVLTHDVETAKGQEKCFQLATLEDSLGFRSSFHFVAEGYNVSAPLRKYLWECDFEVGIHGLYHNTNPFRSKKIFDQHAAKINKYLIEWGCIGYRNPCMYHNLDWIGELEIEYDCSTFDTDPFEPQPEGVGTIFPFWVARNSTRNGYVELPYTLPQDHTIFILMGEKDISIWKKKLDWIAKWGGMALLNVHPDYINFDGKKTKIGEYPVRYYEEFLNYVKDAYRGQYWHVLPRNIARFWKNLQNEKG
jgi:hypothetical protein